MQALTVALNIANDELFNFAFLENILTSAGVVTALLGLIISSIALSTAVYGKNWIKKTNAGDMYKGLRHPPSIVSKLPYFYNGFMIFLSFFFLISWSTVHSQMF